MKYLLCLGMLIFIRYCYYATETSPDRGDDFQIMIIHKVVWLLKCDLLKLHGPTSCRVYLEKLCRVSEIYFVDEKRANLPYSAKTKFSFFPRLKF